MPDAAAVSGEYKRRGRKAPVISGAGGTRGGVALMLATPKRQRLDSEFKVAISRARPRAVADWLLKISSMPHCRVGPDCRARVIVEESERE